MIAEFKPTAPAIEGLQDYVSQFRKEFRRSEQLLWASIYLQGLLSEAERKNIQSMAAEVELPPGIEVHDPMQALQNFINQSPWDENRLARRHRSLVSRSMPRGERWLVIDDVIIPKKGECSVGVQRQFSRAAQRKINCQIAVSIGYISGRSFSPLMLRLYLPRLWQQDPARQRRAGVPERFRSATSRPQQALAMLDELLSERLPVAGVIASAAYNTPDFREGLLQRTLRCEFISTEEDATADNSRDQRAGRALPVGSDVEQMLREFTHSLNQLGLAHFEGRSWRGFHHHAVLVMLAHAFAQDRGDELLNEASV